MGTWLPGAIDALRELDAVGTVYVHTCRISPVLPVPGGTWTPRPAGDAQAEINGIRAMLDAEGLTAVRIWTEPWKPSAHAYVDNKGVNYNGRKGAWKALMPKLKIMAGLKPVFEEDQ